MGNWVVYSDTLAHHGILGMKWGIRRYQNKDGSLTPAGKKRLSKDVQKSYTKNKNQRKFGGRVLQSKIVRNYIEKSETRKELKSMFHVYNRRHLQSSENLNNEANLAAMKAVGGRAFLDIINQGDAEALEKYMTVGQEYMREKSKENYRVLYNDMKECMDIARKYERETRDFVHNSIGDIGAAESSYLDAVRYNIKTSKVEQQSIEDMVVNAILSESEVLAVERYYNEAKQVVGELNKKNKK